MVCSLVLCGDCFRVALFPKFVFSFVCVVDSYLRASATLLPATPRSFVSCSVVSSFFFLHVTLRIEFAYLCFLFIDLQFFSIRGSTTGNNSAMVYDRKVD